MQEEIDGIKCFQAHLYGRKFYIHTDHSALKWLMSIQDPTGRITRWSLLIQQLDFDIIHRVGVANGNTDALSHRLMLHVVLMHLRVLAYKQIRFTPSNEKTRKLARS